MTHHLLGLAHLPTNRTSWCCGFTQKIINLAKILKRIGHQVIFYGGEGSEVACDEFVQVITETERHQCYGDYDWKGNPYRCDGGDLAHRRFNENCIREIAARKQPHDFLLCTFGAWQKPVADACTDLMVVEPGVGYGGIFSQFRVFESYAWMHYLYGRNGIEDGVWYDAVIPNFFDPESYPFEPVKDGYALYFGRITKRKGVDIAIQVTRELGISLVMAGQMGADHPEVKEPHVEFKGPVDDWARARLMGKASMLFVPTYYIEPFGGVAVEAQLCGTPVLTSDWGAFPETVLHGQTGFRCRTFNDFIQGARMAPTLKPADCRTWAVQNYSIERVSCMYEEYFAKLSELWEKGWYTRRETPIGMHWLERDYRLTKDNCPLV